ncbi:MAG: NACHT domain-containing protein, partial [Myxococcota bacterium]
MDDSKESAIMKDQALKPRSKHDTQGASLLQKLQQFRQARGQLYKQWQQETAHLFYVSPSGSWSYRVPVAATFDLQGKMLQELAKDVSEDPWRVMAVLGDTGSGKTLFTRHLEEQLWEAWEENPDSQPLPVWLSLPALQEKNRKNITKAVTATLKQHGLDKTELQELSSKRLVFLLDGYDELLNYHNLYSKKFAKTWPSARVLI